MVRKSKRYSILLGVNIIYIAKFLKAFATKVKKNFYFGKSLISKFFMKIFILKRNILYFKKKNIFLNFVFKTNFLDIKFYNAHKNSYQHCRYIRTRTLSRFRPCISAAEKRIYY